MIKNELISNSNDKGIKFVEDKLKALDKYIIQTDKHIFLIIRDETEKQRFLAYSKADIKVELLDYTDNITLSFKLEDDIVIENAIKTIKNDLIYNLNDIQIVGDKIRVDKDDIEYHFLIRQSKWIDIYFNYLLIKGIYPSKQIKLDFNNFFCF